MAQALKLNPTILNSQSQPIPAVNLVSPQFKANPFPFYARLRADAPVYHTSLPHLPSLWLVTRYEDVLAMLKDERFVKNRYSVMTPEQLKKVSPTPKMLKPLEVNMLDTDEPDHARLRNLIHKAFTPRLVEQMRTRVEQIANELLDEAQSKGRMNLIADFATPLPLTIIAEILGVPTSDRAKFHRWSKSFMSLTANQSIVNLVRTMPNLIFFLRYLRRIVRERRDNPQDDLITGLVQAEEQGDHLTEDELLAMIVVLLLAGHETTVNLIGSGTLALLQHPDQMTLLRENLDNPAMVKTAVEELLRFVSPVEQATERYTHEDITLHGVTIPKGELVFAVIGSANRDENQFANPDTLDITRDPNRHLAFGQGIHYCVGSPLARLEGQIALTTLLRRMPNLRLDVAPEKLRWRSTLVVRGLEALPVRV